MLVSWKSTFHPLPCTITELWKVMSVSIRFINRVKNHSSNIWYTLPYIARMILRICHYHLRESPEQLNWFSKERKFLSWSLSCCLWWIWSYLQGVHQRWFPSVIIDGIENHENKNWQASWTSFLFPHINFFLMEIVQIYHYHDISIKLTATFQLLICMINHLFISLS